MGEFGESRIETVTKSSDILIIGGGVTGLTTAWFLTNSGADVTVVDRQRTGREASWAGAGMLPPGNLNTAATPEARLRALSHSLWDELSAELYDITGIDTGYRRCGSIELFANADHQSESLQQWTAEQLSYETLNGTELQQRFPQIDRHHQNAAWLPEFGQVRNPRQLKALRSACERRGVQILEHIEDVRLQDNGSGLVRVDSDSHSLSAGRICVTAGAWSRRLLNDVRVELPVQPVRGQILQLKTSRPLLDHVVELGRRYFVPRSDGLMLIGSTEEYAGFAKQNTVDGIAQLLSFATSILPDLSRAEIARMWAGLRPGSPDELPYLGRVPGFENLFVGAGHFRSGLQMSPGTGLILSRLLLDQDSPIDLQGLTVDRQHTTLV